MKIPILSPRALRRVSVSITLLLAANASAMVVVERDFPDLVQRAEQIVAGTVTEVTQGPVDGNPITFVTVADLTVMKGTAGSSVTLEIYGGSDGEHTVKVPDMPTFAPGDEVLLFIAGNGENVCPIVGVWQGSFRIRFDDALSTEVITANGGTPIAGIDGGKVEYVQPGKDGSAAAAPMTLDEFRQSIADELANPTAAGR